MELLAITSKVLYDVDIIDKQKEITKIKKELKDNKPPKVIYKNYEEWNKLIQDAIKICEETTGFGELCHDISLSGRNYNMYHVSIRDTILNAFKTLSKGFVNNWMFDYAQTIDDIVVHSIQSLHTTGILDDMTFLQCDRFIKNILIDIFSVEYNDHEEGIRQICCFKCSVCDKLDDWADDNSMCWDCSPETE